MDWWRDPLGALVRWPEGDPRRRAGRGVDDDRRHAARPRCRRRARRGHRRARCRSAAGCPGRRRGDPRRRRPDGTSAHGDRSGRRPTADHRRGRRGVRPATATAVVFGTFLTESPTLVGRPLVAHRRPEWVALEDKTTVDALLDRAGVARAPSTTVDIADAAATWRRFDHGSGSVWAVDARDGFHGGGAGTRWVTDDDAAAAVTAELGAIGDRVRIMPFLDGIATSIHGIVLPDGVVALRPGRDGDAAARPRAALLRLRHVLGSTRRHPRRDARGRTAGRRRAARRGRLPRRLHARRRRHGRRVPADRAQPALRCRARRDHARAG